MYWVCGDMWRGVEYMEELGNAQLWQVSIAGSWRDNASPLRRSPVCSASCATVGWIGRNLRTALDMSHASPNWELQKAQARAAGCRSRQLGRCTFPGVSYLSSVDDFLLPLPLLYLGYREPFKVGRPLQVVWTLACSYCCCRAGEGVCTPVMSHVTQNTMWGFQRIPKEWIQMDFIVIKSIIY